MVIPESSQVTPKGRTSVELFAGGGGLAMAVKEAGFRPLLLNEFATRACETLVENMAVRHEMDGERPPPIPVEGERPPLVVGDVAKVEFDYLRGVVDLLAGGPPCQPFSLGGVARGDEDRRNGFPEMFRAIREMQPKAVICENVRGLLRPSFMPYFDYIKRELALPFVRRADGGSWHDHDDVLRRMLAAVSGDPHERYDVEHFPVNAADYGVPQIRQRVIIVAFRRDVGVDRSRFRELVWPRYSEASLHKAILDGSYWERHRRVSESVRRRVMARISSRPAGLPVGDEPLPWRTLRDALEGIDGQCPLPRTVKLDRVDHYKNVINDHIGWPNARIYPGHTPNELDRPAKTVKAGVHGVPGGESVLLLDDTSHRYMTVRETARVMTFPDHWKLAGPRGEQMRQLGNAVPVKLGQVFAEAVASVLDEAERK
ncbi:DNA (Cytosine-5)-methyltransferase 1 [Frankia canadensis]|uniref:DNA (cytosine-5-)-methyltransferase n=1 Tax=Frankia canadensis TaxID=1836972 RepID=A0A2I2L201_9ACTN|nr:DNA cytosine methyltransferase [Frankia canadensis]SNQ51966.1 DNA (Cytosine-5)-methyltransferase 1 [Frankia canadensis]SOU59256.1 DNA (Cytosine-5)-methyltransferase 1 [Frankia canadensis]